MKAGSGLNYDAKKGPAALAIPHLDELSECFARGIPVFVDAIFIGAEFDLLASRVPVGFAHLLAIEASFVDRSKRLSCRQDRPFKATELLNRDNYELKELGTDKVIASANYRVRNDGTLSEFLFELSRIGEMLQFGRSGEGVT
jgi:hypothetical protein